MGALIIFDGAHALCYNGDLPHFLFEEAALYLAEANGLYLVSGDVPGLTADSGLEKQNQFY